MNQREIFTLLLIIQEVTQRILSQLIGNNILKRELKFDFYKYLRFGEKFRKRWLGLVMETLRVEVENNSRGQVDDKDKFVDECIEFHEEDSDYYYDVIRLAAKMNTSDKQKELIIVLKKLADERD